MEGNRMADETAFYRGEFPDARKYLEQTLSLYDPQLHGAHASTYGQEPGVASLSHGSWIFWHLGYPDQALKKGQKAVALGKDVSHPFSLGFSLCYVAVAHQLCQEEQRVEELVEAAITLSTEQGFVLWLAIATVLRGWVLAKRGQAEEGIAQMRQGLADYKATSANLSRPYLLALLAETYGEVGQPEEGLAILAEAQAVVDKGELRHYEAELYRLKGELLLMLEESEAGVETYFRRAIDVSRRQSAKSLELRAVMSLCRLWHSRQPQGKKDEARQMLGEIYNWFTEGFDTGDLKEARALLEELS
jgi:predicted ATPase